jgi:hypothetical protein
MTARMPDKPTPIGCVIGFFVLLASAFFAMAFWGASKAFAKEPPAAETGNTLVLWGIVAFIPALIGLAFCVFRIATSRKRKYQQIGKSLSS